MCGFAGYWTQVGDFGDAREILARMNDAIRHRGPDDVGYWSDADAGIALGHRRLSIIDLSPLGHQPMCSASGRWVIIFNGEIYNFREIRAELEARGHGFRGHSDTEVLLTAIEAWGLVRALQRCAGMFAFALWDRERRELHLVRDRIGEKPLYYGWMGGTLLFGSELSAMRRHPRWHGEVDRDVLAVYMRHNYVPAPYSVYIGVRKVMPGTVLTFRTGEPGSAGATSMYWSASEAVSSGLAEPFPGTRVEAADELEVLLRRVIHDEMVADVPLGAFLSGGVDSSAVVALMQAQSTRPVRTFTIGFYEAGYNEAEHAKAVARHLGTEHTELYVTPAEAMDVIPRLPAMYTEPFGDSSQIPTFLVAQLARQHVTVSLSGDGGDELFAGYNRHVHADAAWRRVQRLPLWGRWIGSAALRSVSADSWDGVFGAAGAVLPRLRRIPRPGERLHKLARMFRVERPEGVYRELVSQWDDPLRVVPGAVEPPTALTDASAWPAVDGRVHRAMHLDLVSYLPDDILVKVDRATMAVSLESRAPFLDHRVVELAWRFPLGLKLGRDGGKQVLRDVLCRHVPRSLIDRPKMGFAVPIHEWLRGPLRAWAEELLDARRMQRDGLLATTIVRRRWQEHVNGRQNWVHQLWPVLMFQAWLEMEASASGVPEVRPNARSA